jgi:hypothetical protein
MKKLSLLGMVMLFASMTLFGVVIANHGDSGYNGGGEGYKAIDNPLKTLVITGAGHFIQSHTLFQQFLHKIELAELYGVNYDELQGILNEAITGIESAKKTYYEFIKLAAVTPYNTSFIYALQSFNYDEFREKHRLNGVIFSRLASLLRSGDLTGVYQEIYQKTGEISRLLHKVKYAVDKDIFPRITVLWEINQVYFDSYFFGQYAAMIFSNIK